MMREKFLMGSFGICPRVLCERQNALPLGMSEELKTSRVKVFFFIFLFLFFIFLLFHKVVLSEV